MTRKKVLAIGAAFLSVAIWANFLVTTGGAVESGLGVVEMGLLRAVVATVALLPVLWRLGIYPKGFQFWRFAIMVIGGSVGFMFLIPGGFFFAPASDSGIFAPGVMPLWIAVLSWFFLGEKISARRRLGFALIALGVLGVGGFQALVEAKHLQLVGYGLFMSGALCFSFYAIAQRGSGLSALEATALMSVWSLPIGVISALIFGVDYSSVSNLALGWMALAQFSSGVVAVVTYTYAIIHLGPSRGSAFIALTPAIVAVASDLFLGQASTPLTWIGVAVVSVGVFLASGVVERRPAPAAPHPA